MPEDKETPPGYERVYYTNEQGKPASRVQRVKGNYDGLFPSDEHYVRWRDSDSHFTEPEPPKKLNWFQSLVGILFVGWLALVVIVLLGMLIKNMVT